jgi:hypothetical protein
LLAAPVGHWWWVAEAGIGKTRIVAARLADVDELGVWSFEGATDELEQRRPCGVIADCRPLAARPPNAGEQAVAGLLAEGLVALVAALSVRNPVFLVVEDCTALIRGRC